MILDHPIKKLFINKNGCDSNAKSLAKSLSWLSVNPTTITENLTLLINNVKKFRGVINLVLLKPSNLLFSTYPPIS